MVILLFAYYGAHVITSNWNATSLATAKGYTKWIIGSIISIITTYDWPIRVLEILLFTTSPIISNSGNDYEGGNPESTLQSSNRHAIWR